MLQEKQSVFITGYAFPFFFFFFPKIRFDADSDVML